MSPDDSVLDDPSAPQPYYLTIPEGMPEPSIPIDNPMTIQGVALGKKLFFDPILSLDNSQSCGSCHAQEWGFTDNGRRFSEGIDGSLGDRNSMQVINLVYGSSFFWDGRNTSLEEQALGPVPNPIEMKLPWTVAEQRLNDHAEYPDLFKHAFGIDYIDSLHVAKAIAQFERTLISGNSKFDRWLRGEATFTDQELLGQALFNSEKADCFHCHGAPLFTDNIFLNNGLDAVLTELGLGAVTGNSFDEGLFKSPTLRNIATTAPFMHDGRFETLQEVVEFYNSGVELSSPNLDPMMQKNNRPGGNLGLTETEVLAIVAFMETLTDSTFLNNPDFRP
jgi:cytochrome c peroxidase